MENRGAVDVSGGGAGTPAARRGEFGGRRGRFGYFVFGSRVRIGPFSQPAGSRSDSRRAHAAGTCSCSSRAASAVRTDQGRRHGRRHELRDSRGPRSTSSCGRWRPPRQDTRQQTAIVGWTALCGDVAVTASFYQRWSRARLFPADGPLTVQAQARARARDARRQDRRDAFQRTPRPEGRRRCGQACGRRESLAYDYDGYLEFTHLVGLPHIHVTGAVDRLRRRRIGRPGERLRAGQHPGRQPRDRRRRPPRRSLRAARLGDAREPARESGVPGRRAHRAPCLVQPLLRASADRRRAVEQRGPDAIDRGDRRSRCRHSSRRSKISSKRGVTTRARSVPAGADRATIATTDNPVHTTIWPDSRIYSYASFDRARAYGLEAKAEVTVARGPA